MATILPRGSVLLLLTALLTGCDPQDTERLSRMSRTAAAKVERLRGSQDSFLIGLGSDPAARVSVRLRWDKVMEGAQVDVRGNGAEITLQGTVRTVVQRLKAVEIANGTTGVETVIDELGMAGDTGTPAEAP